MRLMKGPRLRAKDVGFHRGVLVVRQTKGDKDRVVMLPRILAAELRRQVRAVRALWEQDRQAQRNGVDVPLALETKYPAWDNVGDGSGCSLLHPCRWTRAQVCGNAITFTRSDYSAH